MPSSYAQSVEAELKSIGREDIFFIDAPVSGGAGRAADGTLTIMAGASAAALEKGQWLLAEMSAPSKLFIVEGGIGQGSNMKMVHQVLAAIQILAVSEAYGFGARLGLNGQEVRDAVVGSDAWSWMFENRSQRTLKEDYFPGASAVTIILKDTVRFLLLLITCAVRGKLGKEDTDADNGRRASSPPARASSPSPPRSAASQSKSTSRRWTGSSPTSAPGRCSPSPAPRPGTRSPCAGSAPASPELSKARQHPARPDLRAGKGRRGREQAV